MRVLVWNEFRHEKTKPEVAKVYPDGIHGAIAGFLQSDQVEVRTATLDEEEHGLTEEVLNEPMYCFGGVMLHMMKFRMKSLQGFTSEYLREWVSSSSILVISQKSSND